MNNHNPWVEKYRPSNFQDIILDPLNKQLFDNILNTNMVPNMLFYGPPGTGKTTTIINFIQDYQKKYNQEHKELVIHLNASDDRGIDIIRGQISSFTNSKYLFNKGVKFIVLDEIDYMTKNAQILLSNLMKESIKDVRFCLICNYISKIDKMLQNECVSFKFNNLPRDFIKKFLTDIVKKEKLINISQKSIDIIITSNKSDIRTMINYIQGLSQSYKKLLTNNDIKILLNNIKNNSISVVDKKINNNLNFFNIEKYQLILQLFMYITENNIMSNELLDFIELILHSNNYYSLDFNKFFIYKLSSLL